MIYKYQDYKMYYEKFGSNNKSILILPGWGNTRNTFYQMIDFFKNNYSIYIMDYPGFGNSPFPKKDMTIFDYAELIKNFLIDLNINNPIIIAHSFGGRIANILTGKFQIKISKMVFLDIAGIKPKKTIRQKIKEKIYKIRKKFIKIFYKKNKEHKLEMLRKKYSSNDYKTLPENMLTTFKNIINQDLRKYFSSIQSEVLILWGEEDIDTPLTNAYYINKVIKDSHLIIFPQGSHFIYLEFSHAINLIINEFIK